MANPDLSVDVIMAAKNRANYIEEAIYSVISQTHTNWHLYIIDDHSTDSTLQIAKDVALKDSRITVMSLTGKQGVYPARNLGLKNSNSKHIAFLDSDDRWHASFLETMLDRVLKSENECIGAFCNFNFINDKSEFINTSKPYSQDRAYIKDLLLYNNITRNGSCQILKRNMLDDTYFNEEYVSSGDYEILLRALSKSKVNYLHYVKDALMDYRTHSLNMGATHQRERFIALNKYLPTYISQLDEKSQFVSWKYNVTYAMNNKEFEIAKIWLDYLYLKKSLKNILIKSLILLRYQYIKPTFAKYFPRLMKMYASFKCK